MKTLNKLSTALGLTCLMLGTFISIGTTNGLNSHAFMPLKISYGSVANAQQYVPPVGVVPNVQKAVVLEDVQILSQPP